MGAFIDLTGQRFGRLTVVERASSTCKDTMWRCQCDCGAERVVRASSLRRGETRSCGCYNRERVKNQQKHWGYGTRLYHIWSNMLQRCQNPNNAAFVYYGERGIAVCDEWHDFSKFQEWAYSHDYREYLTIDRIDNGKGYSPDNCRWVTMAAQNANKRPRYSVRNQVKEEA